MCSTGKGVWFTDFDLDGADSRVESKDAREDILRQGFKELGRALRRRLNDGDEGRIADRLRQIVRPRRGPKFKAEIDFKRLGHVPLGLAHADHGGQGKAAKTDFKPRFAHDLAIMSDKLNSMMKRIAAFFLSALLCFSGTALAAEAGPHLILSPGQRLMGRFVHEHPVAGFAQPIRTEGHFIVAPNDQIVWAIEKPMATTTTISPSSGLVQSVGNFPLLKLTPQQMPFLAEVEAKLLLALRGDWKKLESDYRVARQGDAQKWTITLTPKAQDGTPKPFQKIVARGGAFVDSADIVLRTVTDRVVFSDQAISSAP